MRALRYVLTAGCITITSCTACVAEVVGVWSEEELDALVAVPFAHVLAHGIAMLAGLSLCALIAKRRCRAIVARVLVYSGATYLVFCVGFSVFASFLLRVETHMEQAPVWPALGPVAKIPFLLGYTPWGPFVLCAMWFVCHPVTVMRARHTTNPRMGCRGLLLHGIPSMVLYLWLLVAYFDQLLFWM